MVSATDKRKQLKAALGDPSNIVVAPGCGDPITARLVESRGFGGVHASGSVAHRVWGLADAGILTMTEMVMRLAMIAESVDIPVIADADTGYGAAVNVARTIREYERAGVAALHIEDQLTPKRPIYLEGIEGGTITRAEMVNKIRAAVDARADENLVIIARSEVKGNPKEVVERLGECLEAGADAFWLGGQNPDEISDVCRQLGRPGIGVLPRALTIKEYQAAGARGAVIPSWPQIASLLGQMELFDELQSSGGLQNYAKRPGVEAAQQFYLSQGAAELKRIEDNFGGG